MNSISSGIDSKPRRQVPCCLSGFDIKGWASSLFRRLAWECQDRRSATSSLGLAMSIARPRITISGFFLLCLSQPVFAADSLCSRGEATYFSCSVKNGKLVSLCGNAYVEEKYANDWIEPDAPWLQYRFGLPEKIELTYPLRRKDSLDEFQGDYGSAQQGAVRWMSVSFVSADIGYTVEYVATYEAGSFEGVRIGDPTKMNIKIPAHRKTQYPKATIPCIGKSHHKHIKFYELSRFLTNRNGS